MLNNASFNLIYQSPLETATLQRISAGDSILFMENAVLRLLKSSRHTTELKTMTLNKALFVLKEEIEIRGICPDDLISGIEIIDYPDFVQLTLKHPLIHTWN
ncbi:MAG: sulfurtransferase complex subunit TusB [Methylococcales bacterium]|nr:sulfurtransferase complex subunit TusB [Methylococcales bacterium]